MAANISNSCVVDASYLLAYLLPDETTTGVDATFQRYQKHAIHFVAPTLLRYEVTAGLRSAALKRRITDMLATELTDLFLTLDIEYREVSFEEVLQLALKSKLTVYDASYLWLAKKEKITLHTLDSDLLKIIK